MTNPFKKLLPFLMSGTFLTASLSLGCIGDSKGQDGGRPAHRWHDAQNNWNEIKLDDNGDSIVIPTYGARRDSTKLAFFKANYATAGQDSCDVPTGALPLWLNMQRLKNSETIMGPALYDFAVKLDIYYGFSKQSNTAGLWSGYEGTVKVGNNSKYTQNYRLLIQTHETVHGIQNATKCGDESMTWSIYDFQRSCMATEAAALTSEYLMALEFWSDSIPDLLFEKQDIPVRIRKRLMEEFKIAQADTLPYAQDLANVGEKEFYNQFRDQSWLDFYNNWTMEYYIKCLDYGWLKAPVKDDVYTMDKARMSGYITEDFNFTAELDTLPANMFGTNKRMKQAFEYIECMRLSCVMNDNDSTYLAELERLRADKNPYIGLDIPSINKAIAASTKDALVVMDELAAAQKKPKFRKVQKLAAGK